MTNCIQPEMVWDFSQYLFSKSCNIYTVANCTLPNGDNVSATLHIRSMIPPFIEVIVNGRIVCDEKITEDTCEYTMRKLYNKYFPGLIPEKEAIV